MSESSPLSTTPHPICPGCKQPRTGDATSAYACPVCGTVLPALSSGEPLALPPLPGVPALPMQGSSALQQALPSLPRLPGYEILELLGINAEAETYRARQTGLRRQVTVVLLRPLAVRPEAVLRFRYDARRLARLNHPRLVPLLDVGTYENRLYFTRAYFPGGTLGVRLLEQPLTQTAAIELIVGLAEALQCAHERGLVHGHLTASDVVFDEQNQAHLVGFGLAVLRAEEEPDPVDDVRALGRLLRECLGEDCPAPVEAVVKRVENGEIREARALAIALRSLPEPSASRGPVRQWRKDLTAMRGSIALLAGLFLVLQLSGAGLLAAVQRASLSIDLARADLWIGSRSGTFASPGRVSLTRLVELSERPGIEAVQAFVGGEIVGRKPGSETRSRCQILGDTFATAVLGPSSMLSSRQREMLRPSGTVIVGASDRERLGLSATGDERLILGQQTVRVVGFVELPACFREVRIFCSAETARRVLEVPGDQASYLLARCDEPQEAAKLAAQLEQDWPDERAWDRDALAGQVRWAALWGWAMAWVWGGISVATVLLAGVLLGRRLPSRSRRSLAVGAILLAGVCSGLLARGMITAFWPSVELSSMVLAGGTLGVGLLIALVAVTPRGIQSAQ